MTVSACPPQQTVQHGVVVFVPADFKASYPEFATVPDAVLALNFNLATLQLNNGCNSKVKDAVKREFLLGLLTAHITQLRNGANGNAAGGMVGRINDAQEGSVRASADMGPVTLNAAYYQQTQWGAIYWTSTAIYRTVVYVAAPAVCADFTGRGWPGGFGGGCG